MSKEADMTPEAIEFFVPGIPKPAGSKQSFIVFSKKKQKDVSIITDANKNSKPWKADVKHFAFQTYQGDLLTGPLELIVVFHMPRPKYHYGTGRNADRLKPNAPTLHTKTPDATKLLRGLEDALTGVIWKDDAQVAIQHVWKVYSERPGAQVRVQPISVGMQLRAGMLA